MTARLMTPLLAGLIVALVNVGLWLALVLPPAMR